MGARLDEAEVVVISAMPGRFHITVREREKHSQDNANNPAAGRVSAIMSGRSGCFPRMIGTNTTTRNNVATNANTMPAVRKAFLAWAIVCVEVMAA